MDGNIITKEQQTDVQESGEGGSTWKGPETQWSLLLLSSMSSLWALEVKGRKARKRRCSSDFSCSFSLARWIVRALVQEPQGISWLTQAVLSLEGLTSPSAGNLGFAKNLRIFSQT